MCDCCLCSPPLLLALSYTAAFHNGFPVQCNDTLALNTPRCVCQCGKGIYLLLSCRTQVSHSQWTLDLFLTFKGISFPDRQDIEFCPLMQSKLVQPKCSCQPIVRAMVGIGVRAQVMRPAEPSCRHVSLEGLTPRPAPCHNLNQTQEQAWAL